MAYHRRSFMLAVTKRVLRQEKQYLRRQPEHTAMKPGGLRSQKERWRQQEAWQQDRAPATDICSHLAYIHSPSSGTCSSIFLMEIVLHILNPGLEPWPR